MNRTNEYIIIFGFVIILLFLADREGWLGKIDSFLRSLTGKGDVDFQRIVEKMKTVEQLNSTNLEAIELLTKEFARIGDGDIRKLAYVFASAEHESRLGDLMTELGDRSYFDKYENRKDLGNTQPGDGYRFRGRGYIQITGRSNYNKFSKLLGIDLVGNPNLAIQSEIAAKIAVYGMVNGSFRGKSLAKYFNSYRTDWSMQGRLLMAMFQKTEYQ
ncbi:MAG: hypothetical protein IPJ74_09365 [Saprospiraceae bacterium]|nr:hypothetical protein [Saprospiraceae bacterium]